MRDTTSLSIGREALLSLFSNFIMAILGFVGTVVFARTIGPDGLGVYRTALAVAFVCEQVSDGVGEAIRKRVSEVDTDPREFLGAGLLIHFVISILLLIILLLAIRPAASYFGSVPVALGVGAVIFTLGLFDVMNKTYIGIGYPGRGSWVDTARTLVMLGFQLFLLWLGLEAFGLLVGFAVGTFFTALISAFAAGVVPSVPGVQTFRRIYTFARWSVLNSLVSNLYSSADVIILTAIVGSTATGLYTSAMQLVMPAALLASSIQPSLGVKASGKSSIGQEVTDDLRNSISYSGLFAIPIFFGTAAMPQAIPRTLFGPEFAAAGTALIGMALFQVANVYSSPFAVVINNVGRPDLSLVVAVVVFAVYVPLAVVFARWYGLTGVVAATIIAEVLRLVIYQVFFYIYIGRTAIPKPPLEQALSAVCMFLTLKLILTFVSIDGFLVMSALVGGGAGVYFAVLFVVSSHFRQTLVHVLPLDLSRVGLG
jgi:O-antigen/teichoic acid export membrane protein